MAVTIREVRTKAEKKEFIKLQWKFYKNDPNWVPPLMMDREKILDTEKNPFYQHAEIAMLIADKDGVPSGRIAAITNEEHNKVHNDKLGFFGFFECENDQEVANALFAAAEEWLKTKGMTEVRGPLNPSVNDDLGMLLEGYDDPPRILMPYNPPYYHDLCEGYGFAKVKDLYAYKLTPAKVLTDRLNRGQQLVRERYGLTVRTVDFKNLDKEIEILRDLYNRSWEANWGSVAMTDDEFKGLATDMKQVLGSKYRDYAFFVEINGEPVGFALSLPDLNQLFIDNPSGGILKALWLMLTQTKKITWSRIIALGVVPEQRGKGIDTVMYYETLTRCVNRGVIHGEASWVLEDNTMMNRGAELMNGELYKKYRLYQKSL